MQQLQQQQQITIMPVPATIQIIVTIQPLLPMEPHVDSLRQDAVLSRQILTLSKNSRQSLPDQVVDLFPDQSIFPILVVMLLHPPKSLPTIVVKQEWLVAITMELCRRPLLQLRQQTNPRHNKLEQQPFHPTHRHFSNKMCHHLIPIQFHPRHQHLDPLTMNWLVLHQVPVLRNKSPPSYRLHRR